MSGNSCKIVVAGDMTTDWLFWEAQSGNNKKFVRLSDLEQYPGLRFTSAPGGAGLLANMVEAATKTVNTRQVTVLRQKPWKESIIPKNVTNSYCRLSEPADSEKGKSGNYRIEHYQGYQLPEEGIAPLPVENDSADANLVILDDAASLYRQCPRVWPAAIEEFRREPMVILKMSRPLARGDLWNHLMDYHSSRLILVINANDLRAMGINISRKLSWERTAEDFVGQLEKNDLMARLTRCRYLIVRFGIDGAILCERNVAESDRDERMGEVRLFYDHTVCEDGLKEKYAGDMMGIANAFVSGLVGYFVRHSAITPYGVDTEAMREGVRHGLLMSRKLFAHGFDNTSGSPVCQIGKGWMDELIALPAIEKNAISSIDITNILSAAGTESKPWTIMDEIAEGRPEIAVDIVHKGEKCESLRQMPTLRFGDFVTFDRTEIEAYNNIKNVICEYIENDGAKAPLSIAVFGQPGSGKSFGISQLAKSLKKDHIEKMTFNLAQFSSPDDLVDAFHNIRDKALEGIIPLAFFDEFDSNLDGELGWLKYFLAPMQDGKFKHGENMHPIGKAIFIFAGGTKKTYQEFMCIEPSGVSKDCADKLKSAKGIDFASRLRGYVNVTNVNEGGSDTTIKIRRALILRSKLVELAPHLVKEHWVNIDDGVLRAFLEVPKYSYGPRSIQAILEMSLLKDRKMFDRAALPPREQLIPHVDADTFLKLVSG